MSEWKPSTVREVVQGIENDEYMLPVIQRPLVWGEEKMELLFDSLLKGNSFGGIMVLSEPSGVAPLFASRRFSRTGEENLSTFSNVLLRQRFLVIDGQQRFQAFYMGLRGSFNNKLLHFNLCSNPADYEFQYARDMAELPQSEVNDDGVKVEKCWFPVGELFCRLHTVVDPYQVAEEIINGLGIFNSNAAGLVRQNVLAFDTAILRRDRVGICSVEVNGEQHRAESERRRIVELFRRLNDGGTRLSVYDLVAAAFKGFDYRMESFFKELRQFDDIQFAQDEAIKLVFLLQNDHARDITQVTKVDSDFVINNRDRIVQTLEVVRDLLKKLQLYHYYQLSSRSVVPLYFLAYHIFHKPDRTERLARLYDNHDIANADFVAIKRWLYLSLLNGIFSRGAGWIPYKTGVRKILQVLKDYRGQTFPANEMFKMYLEHPLDFSTDYAISRLDKWDLDFVLYLMYFPHDIAGRDLDHVQPRSKLDATTVANDPTTKRYSAVQINTPANYQLLDPETNRDEKRALPLAEWIANHVLDCESYLTRHLIPEDPSLWDIDKYPEFAARRANLIVNKVQGCIPATVIDPVSPPLPEASFDTAKLRSALHSSPSAPPIIDDRTGWKDVFANRGLGPWAGKYRKCLEQAGLKTIGDFAVLIVALGIQPRVEPVSDGVYRFSTPDQSGNKFMFDTARFGPWGWHVTVSKVVEGE